MDFLGVGPMELLFILIIALIVLGPKDMVKAGRSFGKFLRNLVRNPTWQAVQQTSRDLRYLPNKLMREAGMEEDLEELKKIGQEVDEMSKVKTDFAEDVNKASRELQRDLSAWTTPPPATSPGPQLNPPEAANLPPSEPPANVNDSQPSESSEPSNPPPSPD